MPLPRLECKNFRPAIETLRNVEDFLLRRWERSRAMQCDSASILPDSCMLVQSFFSVVTSSSPSSAVQIFSIFSSALAQYHLSVCPNYKAARMFLIANA